MSTPARGALPDSRRARLLESLHRQGTVRVSELAEELGVTAVTVRRDIAQLTREGVVRRVHGGATLAVPGAREAPDVAAATTAPTRTFGVLVPSLDYYWPGVLRGAEEEARARGVRLVLRGTSYESVDDRPHLVRLVEGAGVDGLLLAPTLDGAAAAGLIAWLAASRVPAVLMERTATVPPHHEPLESVVSDHALGAAMAVRHLADLGHRRIGLVLSRQSPTARHIRTGWLEAGGESGLDLQGAVDERVPDHRSPDWAATVDAIIDRCRTTGTTALLVHADPEAVALVQRCEERGVSVPGDLSVVAYDDEVAGLVSPALTAVRPPRAAVGRAAVALLDERLRDPGRPVHRVVITPGLHLRESTAPPRA